LVRVALVAPNPALRIGLHELLAANLGLTVSAEAGDLRELEVAEDETDVLVLAAVPLTQVAEELSAWRAVLVLTDDAGEVPRWRVSHGGTWGVLSTSATQEELGAAVLALAEGLWVGAPGLLTAMLRAPFFSDSASADALIEPLTARETEVLQHMAEGLANKQIAAKLGISEHTVKYHLSSLYAKLNASSRTEAVRTGLHLGLISI